MTTPQATASKKATPLQLLARTRRSVALLAALPVTPTAETAPQLVPQVVRAVLEADGRTDYVRSGKRYIESGTYEYLWSFQPMRATFTTEVRTAAADLIAAANGGVVTPATAVAAHVQKRFSPRDPRLAWRLRDGRLVLDEIARNYLPSGLLDEYMLRRLAADLDLGRALAGDAFAGVRVLPLLRYSFEALLVTSVEPLTAVPLNDSVLAPAGDVMRAGVWR